MGQNVLQALFGRSLFLFFIYFIYVAAHIIFSSCMHARIVKRDSSLACAIKASFILHTIPELTITSGLCCTQTTMLHHSYNHQNALIKKSLHPFKFVYLTKTATMLQPPHHNRCNALTTSHNCYKFRNHSHHHGCPPLSFEVIGEQWMPLQMILSLQISTIADACVWNVLACSSKRR